MFEKLWILNRMDILNKTKHNEWRMIMSKEKEMLLVGSKTKEALKLSGLNVAGDALDELNKRVHNLIMDAQTRCTANGRKTVRGTDF